MFILGAHELTINAKGSLKHKKELLKTYDTEELLCVLREYEEHPLLFDEDILKELAKCLYHKGIICM